MMLGSLLKSRQLFIFTGNWLYIYIGERRVIGISGSLLWAKTLMELIFNPCGVFWWSPDGPFSQIHSPNLHAAPLRSVQMLKRERVRKAMGSYRTYLSLVKLQPWFLSLWWKTCLRQNCSLDSCAWSEGPALGQNTMMMIYKGRNDWLTYQAQSLNYWS